METQEYDLLYFAKLKADSVHMPTWFPAVFVDNKTFCNTSFDSIDYDNITSFFGSLTPLGLCYTYLTSVYSLI